MSQKESLRLLYMEDDPGLARLFQKRMKEWGYEIGVVMNGREGLSVLDRKSFDAVVIDYQMPVMNGLQVLKELRTRGADIPVIMLTGEGTETVAVEAMKMGATDYLVKDINGKYFELLPMVIEEAVENSRLRREKKEMQKELARSNRELQQFAYVVSHDLKEPLHSIQGFASFLQENNGRQLDEQGREFLGYIIDGGRRMERLIDGLLDYSRVGYGGSAFEAVDMNAVLEEALMHLKGSADKRRASISGDKLPVIYGNERMLVRLLQNLIDNALKYCRETPDIHIGARETDSAWEFAVRDNGIGIDPRHAERIFLIFKRLHSRKEFNGDGLGLAICKKIVEQHQGNIYVEANNGRGATFYFTIPKRETGDS